MIYYDSADLYIESLTTKQQKLAAIEQIQSALITTAMKAATQGAISEYMLNDGQTIIKTVYRTTKEVMASYDALEIVRQRLINQINGRVTRLVDSKNFLRNASFR